MYLKVLVMKGRDDVTIQREDLGSKVGLVVRVAKVSILVYIYVKALLVYECKKVNIGRCIHVICDELVGI